MTQIANFGIMDENLVLTSPNQLWGADLTYIPIGRSFAYLAVILHA